MILFSPVKGMGLSLQTSHVAYQTVRDINPGFCSIRRLGVIALLRGRDAYPSEYVSSTHLYSSVKRDKVKPRLASTMRTRRHEA